MTYFRALLVVTTGLAVAACNDDESTPGSGGSGGSGASTTQGVTQSSTGSTTTGEMTMSSTSSGSDGGGGSGGTGGGSGGAGGGSCEIDWAVKVHVDAGTSITAVELAPSGDVFLAGAASNTSFGQIARPYVAHLSPAGASVWSVAFPASAVASPSALVLGDDTIYVVGSFTGMLLIGGDTVIPASNQDLYLIALDLDGNVLWHQEFGTTGALDAIAMRRAPNGDLVIGGRMNGSVDFGGGTITSVNWDVVIARLSETGQHIASRRIGGTVGDSLRSLDVGADDRIFIGGWEGSADTDFVAAYDPDLSDEIWRHEFAPALSLYPQVAVHDGGDIAILTSNFDLIRLDPDGNELSTVQIPTSEGLITARLRTTSSGGVWVAGTISGTVDFGAGPIAPDALINAMVAQFDPNGTPTFGKLYGGGESGAAPIAVTPQGAIVGGTFGEMLAFCPSPLIASGDPEGFVTKIDHP